MNTESFLSQSTMFEQSSSMTAGKFKIIYGISRHTGEVYNTCLTLKLNLNFLQWLKVIIPCFGNFFSDLL